MAIRLGLGIGAFPFSDARAFWRWVDLCEEGGIDSLWQTDRLASKQPFLESISTMAALAGATERIKFGMNAVVVSVRDPLVTAKQCATIDFLSGGRLLPVFGVGRDTAPEFRATGRSPRARGSRSNEALELMRRLWSEESVSFEGEHYRYEDASISPRPVQQPLPLWIGGSSPAAIRRTARLGTGWLGGTESAKRTGEVIAAIRAEAPKAGRTIPDDHYGATIAFRFGSDADPVVEQAASVRRRVTTSDPRDLLAVGDAAAIRTRIGEYVAAGASKFVMIPLARGDDDLLEQSRRLVGEVLPAFEPRAPV
ncbi:MAG: TIGR03619 family F420-dependent LLM class oxidoreductase [Deltaproteobacteria bacterium]|nr:TIGR03619 family F420-dependent LLM class oxidoreductase [Deltaproteobacteria bacterium]MBW2415442.1 TIGR03619 family F420-dependent LLM class oxidoreductase [Deltaproteobacteria bacterium]